MACSTFAIHFAEAMNDDEGRSPEEKFSWLLAPNLERGNCCIPKSSSVKLQARSSTEKYTKTETEEVQQRESDYEPHEEYDNQSNLGYKIEETQALDLFSTSATRAAHKSAIHFAITFKSLVRCGSFDGQAV